MKNIISRIINGLGYSVQRTPQNYKKAESLFEKYKEFTMIPKQVYIDNLLLVNRYNHIEGCIVECGVWRGGMSAGMAEMLSNKKMYLFDSFEGLPPAKEIDGEKAIAWQKNTEGSWYFDNCKAEMDFAERAMSQSGADYKLTKGWFNETLPMAELDTPVSVLRLDADWYDSTMDCLEYLYPKVAKGGIIILDDYHVWDGCSKAVHDYLSLIKSSSRIFMTQEGLSYIIKCD